MQCSIEFIVKRKEEVKGIHDIDWLNSCSSTNVKMKISYNKS